MDRGDVPRAQSRRTEIAWCGMDSDALTAQGSDRGKKASCIVPDNENLAAGHEPSFAGSLSRNAGSVQPGFGCRLLLMFRR
jgi:hypothetical protein